MARAAITSIRSTCAAAVLVAVAAIPAARAGDDAEKLAARDAKARAYFTNTELVDSAGKPVKFYDDVLKDRVVVITFMFARCTGACPMIAQKLKAVSRELGDEAVGRDVHFVSITVDPENDTPEAMAEFARKQKVERPGWTFLTGTKADVTAVLAKLGERISEPTDHSTGFVTANVRTGHWKRIRPDVPPVTVAEMVRALVAEDRGAASSAVSVN